MFDIEEYQHTIKYLKTHACGIKTAVHLRGYEIIGFDLINHPLVIDSRDMSSLRSIFSLRHVDHYALAFMLSFMDESMFCLNIGAGCGYYAILMDNLVGPTGQIAHFESNPLYYDLLQKNLLFNKSPSSICFNTPIHTSTNPSSSLNIDMFFKNEIRKIDFIFIQSRQPLIAILKSAQEQFIKNPELKILAILDLLDASLSTTELFEYLDCNGFEYLSLESLEQNKTEKIEDDCVFMPLILGKL